MKTCKFEGCKFNKWKDGYCKIHFNKENENKEIGKWFFKEIHRRILEGVNKTPPDFNTEHSTDDLQQDDIIYQKEKIVSPTVQNRLKRTLLKKTRKRSNHVEVYMKFFNYCKDDVIICERCDSKAVDIHHIHGRGKDKNVIENLIALCRECHTLCHSNKDINRHAEVVHLNNVLKELKNRKDKI